MKKLLVICGPTATGKTGLAVRLAKEFNGTLISADSRQVYKQMDIGTGKDKDQVGGVLGYDLVDPKDEFSVAQYIDFAQKEIKKIWKKGKLPILVGGTGFYIKGVIDGIGTADVPKDKKLREMLGKKGVEELFSILSVEDPVKAASLNQSDRKNPRRLIRAIEVASQKLLQSKSKKLQADVLFVGLKADKKTLEKRIKLRVAKRLRQGFEKEVEKLIRLGVGWETQAMQSLGYKQWGSYVKGKISKAQARNQWAGEEMKYAKRQMVWFKADRRVNWFDIGSRYWQKSVEKLVKKWHN